MSKNTNIADLINYISVDGSGNVVLTTGGQVATQSYVTTAVSNLVNAAPSTLDTLNELAAALGNDANFATTVTTSIATKQAQLNGTGFVKVSGTTVSYDNSTYLTTSSASSSYVTLATLQTISGLKTFDATISANYGIALLNDAIPALTSIYYAALSGNSTGLSITYRTGGGTNYTNNLNFPANNNSYLFPSTSGTLALTSSLSAYLPLTGGTLTGALTTTDLNVFDTYANDPLIKLASTTSGNVEVQMRTATTTYNAGIGVVTSGYDFSLFTNNIPRLTIASTGAATFSSSVTANTFVELIGDLRFNSTSADRSIYFRGSAGSPDTNWKMGNYLTPTGATVVTAAATVIDVFNGAGYGFMVRNTSNAALLQIAGNTGAATFSSSVQTFRLKLVEASTATNFTLYSGVENTGSIGFYNETSGLYNLVIRNTGNVGIGTSSPSNILSIRQFNTSTATVLELTNTSTGSNTTKASQLMFMLTDTVGTVKDSAYVQAVPSSGYVNVQYADLTFATRNGDAYPTERMRITSLGGIVVPYVYSYFTTGAAANVVVASNGQLERSVSSLKYKKNVEDYTKGLAEVMQMRPVTYNSINEREDGILYAGLIAEEVHDLGLTEFVQYAEDGSPDALAYQNMVALLVKAIQEQQAQIEELKAENDELREILNRNNII